MEAQLYMTSYGCQPRSLKDSLKKNFLNDKALFMTYIKGSLVSLYYERKNVLVQYWQTEILDEY